MPQNAGTARRYSGINVLILWAEGIGSSSRAAVTENTKQYVIIECQEEKTP